ncbi:hypothetical protein C8J56DRAFT_968742 [Mycena floridula]|nr:hypothetical protein C8J56DRAFT_968742 [Mycena floridula]
MGLGIHSCNRAPAGSRNARKNSSISLRRCRELSGFRHSGRDTSSSTCFIVLFPPRPRLLSSSNQQRRHISNERSSLCMWNSLFLCDHCATYIHCVAYSNTTHDLHLPILLHPEYSSNHHRDELEATFHILSSSIWRHGGPVDQHCPSEQSLPTCLQ